MDTSPERRPREPLNVRDDPAGYRRALMDRAGALIFALVAILMIVALKGQ